MNRIRRSRRKKGERPFPLKYEGKKRRMSDDIYI